MFDAVLRSPRWNAYVYKRVAVRHLGLTVVFVLILTTLYYTVVPETSVPIPHWVSYTGGSTPLNAWDARAVQVKKAFMHAYHGYERHSAPHDELCPLSNKSIDNFNGWGVTVFDSLDTMILMGLHDEFARGLRLVEKARFPLPSYWDSGVYQERFAPFFETAIRYLGGLLSAYALSHEPVLLDRADHLAQLLGPVFNTPSGFPSFGVNTETGHTIGPTIGILAEIASCQLEYTYLAQVTGKKDHFDRSDKIWKALQRADLRSTGDMMPKRWNLSDGQPYDYSLSVGGATDSAHEYLLKQYLLTAKTDKFALDLYIRTTNQILTHMLYVSENRELLYVTNTKGPDYVPSHKFEHLSCFLPGLLALGAHSLPLSLDVVNYDALGPTGKRSYKLLRKYNLRDLHMWAAEGLATSCWLMYADQVTGLGPEEVLMRGRSSLWIDTMEQWRQGGSRGAPPGLGKKEPVTLAMANFRTTKLAQKRDYGIYKPPYILRPETIESIYIMWRATGDSVWRERGWTIFQAIERETKTNSGYASLKTVEQSPAPAADEMPSYFLAETLKYLYLLFYHEDLVPLDKWVFNTEAHPFPIFSWSPWERRKFGIPEPSA